MAAATAAPASKSPRRRRRPSRPSSTSTRSTRRTRRTRSSRRTRAAATRSSARRTPPTPAPSCDRSISTSTWYTPSPFPPPAPSRCYVAAINSVVPYKHRTDTMINSSRTHAPHIHLLSTPSLFISPVISRSQNKIHTQMHSCGTTYTTTTRN
ncbi:hypothetical protein VPH35_092523 [Triticum aestivum]